MASFSSLRTVLEPYIDIPFNQWLILILLCTYVCALRQPGALLVAVLTVSAAILLYDTTSTTGAMIKTICELPLGLGSILIAHTMTTAHAEGRTEMHFLRGQEPYKYTWGAVDSPTWKRVLTPAG